MTEVNFNPGGSRYELAIEGTDELALAFFQDDENGSRVLTHTEVPYQFSGQGIASRLARGVFEDARQKGIRLVLKCPFMAGWYARNPDYGDVVGG